MSTPDASHTPASPQTADTPQNPDTSQNPDTPDTRVRPDTPALAALEESGIDHEVTVHGPVRSLEEAAAARGLEPRQILKTLVVRRTEDDFLFVLVPGDREISWPKLRALLGVSRLSMPDKDVARDVTGYERGTITPFGARPNPATGAPWRVIADALVVQREGPVSIGGGAHGVAATVDPASLVEVLSARVADVTDAPTPR